MDRTGSVGNLTVSLEMEALAAVLRQVLSLLDERGVSWCISHGFERLPWSWGTDVDIVVRRSMSASDIHDLIESHAERIGARPIGPKSMFVTLAITSPDGPPRFLKLDFAHDATFGRHLLYRGEEILADRKRQANIWVPAADKAFDIVLTRAVLKANPETWSAVAAHFFADPAGARRTLERRWSKSDARVILAAITTGDRGLLRAQFTGMRRRLAWRSFKNAPVSHVATIVRVQAARLGHLLWPRGVHVALLGPDGAGKSSVITALEQSLAPLFTRSEIRGFAPSLRLRTRRETLNTSTPQALPARSVATSLLRAGFWLAYGLFSRFTLRWAKARNRLILNDRHFVDILVDPVRYRYGGPRWILHLIWKTMAKPDIVILLHGPAEVLQARKKELTVAETARQCEAYLALVRKLSYGHVIDATRPPGEVAAKVCAIVLDR